MDRIERAKERIQPLNQEMTAAAQTRLRNQARPAGSLGVLETVAARMAGIKGTLTVQLKDRFVVTCAGDHGVCEERVSLFPGDVTKQMVYNFVAGGASVNVLARHAGARVVVADLGVNGDFPRDLPIFHKKIRHGTDNFVKGPAMTREEAIQSITAGMEIVDELTGAGNVDILVTGDMGIGNTTPSTAIIAAFSGISAERLVGRGTGVDEEGLKRKTEAIRKGLSVNEPDPQDPIDVLSKVGGFEIGGIAGVVLGAAERGLPVVTDGLIATAGALVACELIPAAAVYLFAGHMSKEAGHRYMLERLSLRPLLDLGFRLGEGTGAVLALPLIDAANRILSDIKTFDEVAITDVQQHS